MRILGIDFGTKRIGLAISDESETIAFAHAVIVTKEGYVRTIIELIQNEGIGGVVIGISKTTDGQDNLLEEKRKKFVEELQKNVTVFEIDERFSSHEARLREFGNDRRRDRQNKINRKMHIDAEAAQIILQRFLDSRK